MLALVSNNTPSAPVAKSAWKVVVPCLKLLTAPNAPDDMTISNKYNLISPLTVSIPLALAVPTTEPPPPAALCKFIDSKLAIFGTPVQALAFNFT